MDNDFKFEEKFDELMKDMNNRNAMEGLIDCILRGLSEAGDDKAMLMYKEQELHKCIEQILGNLDTLRKISKGQLVPLVSLIDQAIECANDILKEVKEG